MSEPGLFPASDLTTDLLGERGGPGDMLRTAHLSDDGVYRYRLIRSWGGRRMLRWIMLNPSTADHQVDDPTIRRCIGFARTLGFDGIEVLNLYAYRATRPAELWVTAEPTGGQRNDIALANLLVQAAYADLPVIAAWGAHAETDRVAWLADLPGAEQLRALHITKTGAPGHPLYLPGDCLPIPWSLR